MRLGARLQRRNALSQAVQSDPLRLIHSVLPQSLYRQAGTEESRLKPRSRVRTFSRIVSTLPNMPERRIKKRGERIGMCPKRMCSGRSISIVVLIADITLVYHLQNEHLAVNMDLARFRISGPRAAS